MDPELSDLTMHTWLFFTLVYAKQTVMKYCYEKSDVYIWQTQC